MQTGDNRAKLDREREFTNFAVIFFFLLLWGTNVDGNIKQQPV
jgi:hypothetical protein